MKLKLLSTVALITTFLITGCDGEDKTDCKKDPTAKDVRTIAVISPTQEIKAGI
ncbi:hypothetical protein [Klebsiella quasipneumoniae]|uniref:hypothetical protein n=1 Tax=Klebsiella quasipneumoniae TaxID=1463165 RepID=UPI00388CFC7E